MLNDYITVNYKVYSTAYQALKALDKLPQLVSYDCETQSSYTQEEIAEAKDALTDISQLDTETMKLCKVVANSSGLSFPSITKITHFIFGISKDEAIIIVCSNYRLENLVLNWLANTDRTLIMWNAGFDAKQIYVKTGKIPKHIEDGQMLLKCHINHCDIWSAKVGLKDFMSEYYDPTWALEVDYNNTNLKDKKFLKYCAIDGCGTWYAWELMMKDLEDENT